MPGYKWQANRDSTSVLARASASADANAAVSATKDLPQALAEECDRRPECEGFSSAGALKSDTAAQRVVAANGVCLYTKLRECRHRNAHAHERKLAPGGMPLLH